MKLQTIEKSKAELEWRIKEREGYLRSLSRRIRDSKVSEFNVKPHLFFSNRDEALHKFD